MLCSLVRMRIPSVQIQGHRASQWRFNNQPLLAWNLHESWYTLCVVNSCGASRLRVSLPSGTSTSCTTRKLVFPSLPAREGQFSKVW